MRLDDGRALPAFMSQALKGEDITVFGDGSQTRSFCYVSDLIDGLEKLLFTDSDVHGPINIGNPTEFTIYELAELVIRQTNSNSKIEFSPLPQDDPKQRKPDISLARNILKWEPSISLSEGLSLSIPYFLNKIQLQMK
jgi:dTDP-glucose 4,6-dehydratase